MEKEKFIKIMQEEIALAEELQQTYQNAFLTTLKEFDGKMYTKRFRTALESVLPKSMTLRELNKFQTAIDFTIDNDRYVDGCGLLNAAVWLHVVLYDGRIDYERTINNDCHKKWISNLSEEISQRKDAIVNYDSYEAITLNMVKAVNAYNKLNFWFRSYANKGNLRIY